MAKNNKKPNSEINSGTLGTFAGVFTPSILTILGIILFLRLGYVVGNAGLAYALIILALANGISVLTTFSLSAIATNLKVKGGGAVPSVSFYFWHSRFRSPFIVSDLVRCLPGRWHCKAPMIHR
jgi:hypothetical protein